MSEPPPIASSDDKLWIILSHASILVGVGLILPLVVYLVKKDSPLVAEHSKEALNFHISVIIYAFASVILAIVFIGFLMLAVLAVGTLVLAIVACVKASDNELYRYPATLRLVK